jgi:hypothetical protein
MKQMQFRRKSQLEVMKPEKSGTKGTFSLVLADKPR